MADWTGLQINAAADKAHERQVTATHNMTRHTKYYGNDTDLAAAVSAQCHNDRDTDTAMLLSNVTCTSAPYRPHNENSDNDDDDDNNLHLIMVKTNRSTLHVVYNIQQSATQGSNDTTHTLSCSTAATTSFSAEGIGCQKQTAPSFCQQSDQAGLYLASIHHMAPPKRGRTYLITALLLIY